MRDLRTSTLATRREIQRRNARLMAVKSHPNKVSTRQDVKKRVCLAIPSSAATRQHEVGQHTLPPAARPITTLGDLPSEIRLKIFEYTVALPYYVSSYRKHMVCLTPGCGITLDPRKRDFNAALRPCLKAFHLCRQFRVEAFDAFMRVNVWRVENVDFISKGFEIGRSLSGPRDSSLESAQPKNMSMRVLTQSLGDLFSKKLVAQDVKHFYITVDLSERGHQWVSLKNWPKELDSKDLAEVQMFVETEIRERRVVMGRLETEQEVSDTCAKYIMALAEAQQAGLCKPRSLTMDVTMHEAPEASHLGQCGLTLRFNIKMRSPGEPNHEQPSDETIRQALGNTLEPKRNALLPLLRAKYIDRIAVQRSWVLEVELNNLTIDIHNDEGLSKVKYVELVPITVRLQYTKALDMLKAGGPNFQHFRKLGWKAAGVREYDVVSAFENKDVAKVLGLIEERNADATRHAKWIFKVAKIREPVAILSLS